jgi:hypothetical protein
MHGATGVMFMHVHHSVVLVGVHLLLRGPRDLEHKQSGADHHHSAVFVH